MAWYCDFILPDTFYIFYILLEYVHVTNLSQYQKQQIKNCIFPNWFSVRDPNNTNLEESIYIHYIILYYMLYMFNMLLLDTVFLCLF